jgi:hypothetical protein
MCLKDAEKGSRNAFREGSVHALRLITRPGVMRIKAPSSFRNNTTNVQFEVPLTVWILYFVHRDASNPARKSCTSLTRRS